MRVLAVVSYKHYRRSVFYVRAYVASALFIILYPSSTDSIQSMSSSLDMCHHYTSLSPQLALEMSPVTPHSAACRLPLRPHQQISSGFPLAFQLFLLLGTLSPPAFHTSQHTASSMSLSLPQVAQASLTDAPAPASQTLSHQPR